MKKIILSLGAIIMSISLHAASAVQPMNLDMLHLKSTPITNHTKIHKYPYIENVVGEVKIKDFEKKLGQNNFLFKIQGFKITKVLDISKELYLVKATRLVDMRRYGKKGYSNQPIELYVTKSGKTFIAGNVMDDNGKPLKPKLDLAINKDLAAMTYGNGDKELYVFTDPDCPFCTRFEKRFKDLKKEYKLYIYFYPIPNLHKNSHQKAEYILSFPKDNRMKIYSKIQGEKYTGTEWKKKTPQFAKQLLKDMMKYETEYVGIKGTPTVLDKDGQMVNRNTLFKENF